MKMTFKNFVHQTIISNCEKNARKLLKNEHTYIVDSAIEELDMTDMTYKVKLVVHETNNYFDRVYYIGGAFSEYATLYDSVIWNSKGEIIWMYNESTRKQLGLNDSIKL